MLKIVLSALVLSLALIGCTKEPEVAPLAPLESVTATDSTQVAVSPPTVPAADSKPAGEGETESK